MSAVVDVSVVIPTAARVTRLDECLESLRSCSPRAREIVLSAYPATPAVRELAKRFAGIGVRLLECERPGIAYGMNHGIEAAASPVVAMTNDDCTVEPEWVRAASEAIASAPEAIVTGRVRAAGDPAVIPSVIDESERVEYTGQLQFMKLYCQSLAFSRSALLDFGGFDEGVPPAEDNDLCYRWLRAGRRLIYEPAFVVWHHDWRSAEQLERVYMTYSYGQGMFFAKHLRRGDLRLLPYLLKELAAGAAGSVGGVLGRTPPSLDSRQAILRGLPRGFLAGWRAYGSSRR